MIFTYIYASKSYMLCNTVFDFSLMGVMKLSSNFYLINVSSSVREGS